MKTRKNTWIAAVLLFLVGFLAVLILFRMIGQQTKTVPDVVFETTRNEEIPAPASDSEDETAEASENEIRETSEKPVQESPRPLREICLSDRDLDPLLFERAEEQGTVSIAEYLTRDYFCDEYYDIRKQMAVYLPYGYDEKSQYDVLVLLHCGWADYRFWLVNERDYCTPEGEIKQVYVKDLLDNMIQQGYCRPLIVLAPCCYLYDNTPNANGNRFEYEQMKWEVGEDLLRFTAENYATWAEDGSRESLLKAREHFGFFGASFGAYVNYISIIGPNYDLAANYAFTGGGAVERSYLLNTWNEKGTKDLPMKCLYIAEGEFDDRAAPEASYYTLLAGGDPFSEDNLHYTMVAGSGHVDHTYLVALYNTLQLFFTHDSGS